MESIHDMISRLNMMSDRNQTKWDLSENDCDAIKWMLEENDKLLNSKCKFCNHADLWEKLWIKQGELFNLQKEMIDFLTTTFQNIIERSEPLIEKQNKLAIKLNSTLDECKSIHNLIFKGDKYE